MDGVRGLGRAIFAAVFLGIAGTLNIIYGIAGISKSHVFTNNAHYVFGDLKTWGWITLLIGILEILASLSLFGGGAYGRVVGVIAGALAAVDSLLAIPAFPLLGLAGFGISLWIIHGLIVFGSDVRAERAGALP